ncbi:MAG: aminopeptidase [Spirochaetes bacterium]|nr:aminopeptidase [Spirochaetota bacterium]
MLTKVQLERYADVLIWGLETARTKKYRPYDVILLRYELPALALAEVLHRKLLDRRWHVIVRGLLSPGMERDFFMHTDSRQRKYTGRWEEAFMKSLNGNIFLTAPESLTHLKDVDPKRINELALARKPMRKIMERREEQGHFGWTLCTYPTEEPALRARLTLEEYAVQIVKACFLNTADPVAKWEEIHGSAGEIKRWLNAMPVETLRVESRSCDLSIRLGNRRRFIGISGHNIPSFEIFTSPDCRGTTGRYHANLPSYRSGNYIEGITLEFRKGNVVESHARKGEDFLKKMLAMDTGARRLGEFSLTDRRFSRINSFMADTLFDENFGGDHGNCHIAVGSSYSDTFAGNPASLTPQVKRSLGYNDSALHWDMVNTEDKIVTAALRGGKSLVIYEKGMFRY